MADISTIVGPAPEETGERRSDEEGGGDGGNDGEMVLADPMMDGGGPSSLIGMGPPSPLTGCYLLIVLGEPHSDEHKDVILQRLIKGKREQTPNRGCVVPPPMYRTNTYCRIIDILNHVLIPAM